MTSSFGTVIGTPRDEIPDLPIGNYEQTEPDLSEKVNQEIEKNQRDTSAFYQSITEIEQLKVNNFFDNLSGLEQLIGKAAQFKEQREANREARETLDKYKGLSEEARRLINEQESLAELNEAELIELLTNLAIDKDTGEVDEVALELLKLQFYETEEEFTFKDIKNQFTEFSPSAFNTYIDDHYLYSAATEAEALGIADNAIEFILTKLYTDLVRDGVDINSREVQSYINRQLLPKLIQEQEAALNTYKQTTYSRYLENVDQKLNTNIIDTLLSTESIEDANGTISTVYNGDFESLIDRVQKIKGFDNKSDALRFILNKLPDLKSQLNPGSLEYLLYDVEFIHSATGETINGLVNADFPGVQGNIVELKQLYNTVVANGDEIVQGIEDWAAEEIRQMRIANGGEHPDEGDIADLIAERRKRLIAAGYDPDQILIPGYFFGDNTTSSNPYSEQVEYFKLANSKNWLSDWQDKTDTPLDSTAIFQVERAQYELIQDLQAQQALQDTDAATWIAENYKTYLDKLVAGDYEREDDDLRRGLISDFKIEVTQLSSNPTAWMNNEKFNTIYEKQALNEFIAWKDGGYVGDIPVFLNMLGAANGGQTGMEYAFERLEALGLWDPDSKDFIGNPEDLLELNEEEKRYLLLKPTTTRNILLLDTTDDDRTYENKLLRSLEIEGRSEDFIGGMDIFESFGNRILKPGLEVRTIEDVYNLAKEGKFDDFGVYGFTAQELIEAVDGAGVNLEDDFDRNMQDFLVLSLMRVQANKSNSIMGAVTEGYDWRMLIRLNDEERKAVLSFFPNLRDMPQNQFQNLQSDIALAILTEVEQARQTVETGELVTTKEDAVITPEFIQNNPELTFLKPDISEENIAALLERDVDKIVKVINLAGTSESLLWSPGREISQEQLINIRLFFENRIKQGLPVPEDIRKILQNTRNMYSSIIGNKLGYKDNFNYMIDSDLEGLNIGYDKEKFKLIMGDDGNYRIVPKDEEEK